MKAFSELFKEEYNTQREQWENNLKKELKLDEITSKTSKKHLDLGPWPTLSLSAEASTHLSSQSPWKKAAQTYVQLPLNFATSFREDLEAGVRIFFFQGEFLKKEDWLGIETFFRNYPKKSEVEIYLLGQHEFAESQDLQVYSEKDIFMSRKIQESGGHNVHELGHILLNFIEAPEQDLKFALFMDSHFFKNIAKIRALRLLIARVQELKNTQKDYQLIALNSYREWTLYERYSNMLRNDAQVASAYIGGADVVQTSGYQTVFELEGGEAESEHQERSWRMARNTSHILALESMLGMVEDAAFGSFHLENLTQKYAQEAWSLMQKLIVMKSEERQKYLETEVNKVREIRLERVKTRKDILAGMNDFPDVKEKLELKKKLDHKFFRVSQIFEDLRLRVEALKKPPVVEILLEGEYAALNNRVNFIKNYFELIGLQVIDPIHPHAHPQNRILVLCAADADYETLGQKAISENAIARYVAGKVEVSGFESIHAGQNVYDVLLKLVQKLEVAK